MIASETQSAQAFLLKTEVLTQQELLQMPVEKSPTPANVSIIALFDHKLPRIEIGAMKTFVPKTRVTCLTGLFGTRLTELFGEALATDYSPSWTAYKITSASLTTYIRLATTGLLYLGSYDKSQESILRSLVARYDFVTTLDDHMPFILYNSMDAFNPSRHKDCWYSADYANIIKGVNDAEKGNICHSFENAIAMMKLP